MNIERATKFFSVHSWKIFSASFGQMLHSLYHQIAVCEFSIYTFGEEDRKKCYGANTQKCLLVYFLTNPNIDCNKSACLINKILLLVKYSHAPNSSIKVNFILPTV